MSQLSDLLVYSCLALIVPIALARLLVRADWRTVLHACLIWYGFLFLAMGGFKGHDNLGWVFVLAMFLSIPALPAIALALKLWKRLAQRTIATAVTVPDGRWSRRIRLPMISPAQWLLLALLAAGCIMATYWS